MEYSADFPAYPMAFPPKRAPTTRNPRSSASIFIGESNPPSLELTEAYRPEQPRPTTHTTETIIRCIPVMPSDQLHGQDAFYIPYGWTKRLRVHVSSIEGYGIYRHVKMRYNLPPSLITTPPIGGGHLYFDEIPDPLHEIHIAEPPPLTIWKRCATIIRAFYGKVERSFVFGPSLRKGQEN
jgi:hypothetical protein